MLARILNGCAIVGCLGLACALFSCERQAENGHTHARISQIETVEQFELLVLRAETPVVVDFYATWCVPCQKLAPILDELAGEYEGRVAFYRVDAELSSDLAGMYRVRAYPTVVFFDAGEPVHRWTGLGAKSDYAETIDEYLLKPAASE